MQIQQLNRNDAERVQLVVKCVEASSITTGMAVALCVTAASGDGVQAVINTTTLAAKGMLGIAAQDIASNAYGLVTAWGYAASVLISQSVGSWTITAGDVLVPGGQSGAMTSVVTAALLSTQMYKYVVALGALSDTISNPRPYMSGLVRAL